MYAPPMQIAPLQRPQRSSNLPTLYIDRVDRAMPPSAYNGPPSSTGAMTPLSARPEGPKPVETTYGGWNWKLDVAQQPVRARMCGFGDKDRRPITPPPCIRLVVTDPQTGEEVDPNEIDVTFFVLTCDLWDEKGSTEVNLVKHSSTSPSISTATATSYPPPSNQSAMQNELWNQIPVPHVPPPTDPYRQRADYLASRGYVNYGPQGQYPQNPQYPSPHPNHAYAQSPSYQTQSQYGYTPSPVTHTPTSSYGGQLPSPTTINPSMGPPGSNSTMFTRNLIGSLSASAFRLYDNDKKPGIWFVLQDLSVRTEGLFRLKMSFVNVGTQIPRMSNSDPANSDSHGANGHSSSPTQTSAAPADPPVLNQGSAPVLASIYSEPFQVFSAKKFPGVIESTPLSRTFALQGIKIPIRKDGKGGVSGRGSMSVAGGEEEDDYEGQDE